MFYQEEVGLTYDDVLLLPQYSEVLPHEVSLHTQLTQKMKLSIPLISSAMDTVTEWQTAVKMAQLGGLGVIHKNMSIEEQIFQVERVKKYESGVIQNPVCVHKEDTLRVVLDKVKKYGFSGFPVIDDSRKILGIITNRDIRYENDLDKKVHLMMTDRDHLVVAPLDLSLDDMTKILHEHRIEKLPLVDENDHLKGMMTIRDIQKMIKYPHSTKDDLGRLSLGAACGVSEKERERAEGLIDAGVDVLVIDTAHGHSRGVIEMIKDVKNMIKRKSSNTDIIAGNIATTQGCEALVQAGVDAVKVGIGPGSICTTRVIAGVGVPQLQALWDCKKVCEKSNVSMIADGGIKYSGDIVKALASGAQVVMIGSLFAGTDEAPGERIVYQGRSYKLYRGMGSLASMALGSKDRYGQAQVSDVEKLVPEGIEGQVPYRGPLSENVYQLTGGIRSGMGYLGASHLVELQQKAKFVKISPAGLKESHPHDVMMFKEAPNYHSNL